jgi:transcriptional regulator with XRE-family HTH domain
MATKVPDLVDKHVGSRVRMRRLMLGMSQEELGDKLGISFQQVQKYEKGTNRISASRLHEMSEILQVPVPFFFDGAPRIAGHSGKGAQAPSPAYVSHSKGTVSRSLLHLLGQIDIRLIRFSPILPKPKKN